MPLAELPQSNKQHAVPQNIMDVEFKLIGDLTMRQFSYLMVFGILVYLSSVVVIGIFKWPLMIIFSLLGVGFAFIPIGERGMDDWVVSFIKAINSPTQRVWKKEPEIPTAFSYDSVDVIKQELITLAPTQSRRKLEEYLKYQVEGKNEDPLDIPEQEYILKVRNAFSQDSSTYPAYAEQSPLPSSGVSTSVIDVPEYIPSPLETPEIPGEDIKKEEEVEPNQEEIKSGVSEYAERKIEDVEQIPGKENKFEIAKPQYKPDISTGINKNIESSIGRNEVPAENIIKSKRMPLLIESNISPTQQRINDITFTITPDMHSGRKFTNLVPSNGELVLPSRIKRERVIPVQEELDIQNEIKEKTEKLNEFLNTIEKEENLSRQKDRVEEIQKEEIHEEVKTPVKPIEENITVSDQKTPSKVEETIKTEVETKTQEDAQVITETKKEGKPLWFLSRNKKAEPEPVRKENVTPEIYFGTKKITDKPDVLSGVVKNGSGSLMPGVLLIVKNVKGEPVRAFKTDSIGQFVLLTPLDKGSYNIEVSPSNNLSETFDIIPVEVKGEVIPSLEFIGR